MADVYVVVNPKTEPDVIAFITSGGGSGGGGDMYKAVYDPTGVNADTFDYNNLYNTPGSSTVVFENDHFVAAGVTSDFQLSNGPAYIVYAEVNGLIELESEYSLIDDIIYFSYVPLAGDTINIKYTL